MSWFIKPGMPFKQVSELLKRHYKEIESGGGKNFYLVCGEESFLVHRVTRRLASSFTSQDEFNTERVTILEGDVATGSAVLKALAAVPFNAMFGERSVVIARNPSFIETSVSDDAGRSRRTRTQSSEELLCLILSIRQRLHSRTVLIIAVDAPMNDSHPVVQAAFEFGVAIFLSRLKQRELLFFVESICKRLGARIQHDAIGELLLRVGEDLWQINSELEKLTCYAGERHEITVEDVRDVVPSLAGDVFGLVNFLMAGEVNRARSLIRNMIASREPLVKVIYMLARQYRLLMQARWLIDSGIVTKVQLELWLQDLQTHLRNKLTEAIRMRLPKGERLSLLSQHPYAIKVLLEQAQSHTMDDIVKAIVMLRDIDVALKTGRMREEEAADWLVIRLCQLSRSKGRVNA
ncbi:MAG: DNA polymerase III subunit delta [Armatimonadota bacterium]|nr:DNA polymerase III subunit delta [Armatimonadota bacterium]MDW8024566.1 DNA polymerase III subunit delta [Armatimonadota bacterium]